MPGENGSAHLGKKRVYMATLLAASRRLLPARWAAARALFPALPRLLPSLHSRALCNAAAPSPPPLLALPKFSDRKARIMQHGLIGLSASFVRQKAKETKEAAAAVDKAFRVQNTYTVPLDRPAEFACSRVFGFGRARSKALARSVGVHGHYPLTRMRESQRAYIRRELNAACINYDNPEKAAGAALKKEISLNIQRLKDIKCYRGVRH